MRGAAAPEPVQGISANQCEDGNHGQEEDAEYRQPLPPRSTLRRRRPSTALEQWLREEIRLLGRRGALDAPPVLVDEGVRDGAQVIPVGAEVPLDVGRARRGALLLVLEGTQVLGPDLRVALGGADVYLQPVAAALQHLADREALAFVPGHHGGAYSRRRGADAFWGGGGISRAVSSRTRARPAPARPPGAPRRPRRRRPLRHHGATAPGRAHPR